MVEWKTYRLGDICKYVTIRTSHIENYISTENMLPDKGGICAPSNVPDGTAVEYKVGDILISNIRPYFRKIWQADCNGTCSADVLCIRVNEDVDGKYLYYLLSQQAFFDYVMAGAKGCKMPRGDKKQIMQWEVFLPPLPEQKRIAGILSALDDKIELNRRINANLEAQAMALYKHWFVDFEFPNSAEKPYKSSSGKMIDSDFGPIPAGWHIGKVNDLGIIICGKTPSKAIAANYGDAIPFIKIPDMHNHVFVHKSDEMLSIVGSDSQIKKLLPPYSILVSCIATVGLVSMNVVPSHTNQQINSVIPNDVIYRYYLYLMFKNMALDLQNYGRGGTATLNVNTSTFANIKVLLPSRQILEWFI